jgi:hypothetical protein
VTRIGAKTTLGARIPAKTPARSAAKTVTARKRAAG